MVVENRQTADYSPVNWLLIACGAIGPILFIVVFLIEGATRPGYSAWRNFVSDLSESSLGWIQIASFLVCGALVFCFAFGLRRVFRSGRGATWGPLLLGAFGLSLIVAGIFVTDPSLGYYPDGTPAGAQTLHGTIHGVAAPVVFGLLTAATFVFAWRFAHDPLWRGWGAYSLVTGVVCVVTFIACLATAVLDEHGVLPNSPTGLLERIAIIVGWGWIALLAIRLLRQMRRSSVAKAPSAAAS
jgi:hypothetical protein